MKKYSVRPATLGDLEAVYALIAAQNLNDFGDVLISMDGLQQRWQNIHFETQTCMAYTDGELEGYAELRDGDSPLIYLADKNNIDLGFQLLMVLEDFAKNNKITKLFAQVSTRNQTLQELFLLNGYHSNLSFVIMELVMNEQQGTPAWPDGIQARTFIPNQDEQAAFRADEEAAQDKGYHTPLDFEAWAKRMGLNIERFDPSLWFLAWDGNEIAGVALNYYDRRSDTGWIDHLGVRRAWRNKGIGKALLLHSFAEFYRRGIRHIKLSVDAKSLTNAPRLYESVGMRRIHEYHIYKKELPIA